MATVIRLDSSAVRLTNTIVPTVGRKDGAAPTTFATPPSGIDSTENDGGAAGAQRRGHRPRAGAPRPPGRGS